MPAARARCQTGVLRSRRGGYRPRVRHHECGALLARRLLARPYGGDSVLLSGEFGGRFHTCESPGAEHAERASVGEAFAHQAMVARSGSTSLAGNVGDVSHGACARQPRPLPHPCSLWLASVCDEPYGGRCVVHAYIPGGVRCRSSPEPGVGRFGQTSVPVSMAVTNVCTPKTRVSPHDALCRPSIPPVHPRVSMSNR
jgi:hypothetical protein